jgi:hypothetical protein
MLNACIDLVKKHSAGFIAKQIIEPRLEDKQAFVTKCIFEHIALLDASEFR